MGAEATYSYREVADRVEEVLGERPSLSALRAAAAVARRTPTTQGRPRLTAGMPAPAPARSKTSPAVFSQRKVEAWLRRHPRRVRAAAREALVASAANPRSRLEVAVRKARQAGLSWRVIADGITEGSGVTHSLAGVHKAYRYLDGPVHVSSRSGPDGGRAGRSP
ncbi:hypothetical protein [Intrasporangium sp.]|uniref:hypothetical protein n=1 Tax=Intrasporangium sp. TaxID=1925024 RepID=UPI0026498CEE|nr:hypothetical protein [Intrasporangium sp.]